LYPKADALPTADTAARAKMVTANAMRSLFIVIMVVLFVGLRGAVALSGPAEPGFGVGGGVVGEDAEGSKSAAQDAF
jgi:hypothetical protein